MNSRNSQVAVEEVIEAFYKAIGTPAPAPGIERLARLAVEAARPQLMRELLGELTGEEMLASAERHDGRPAEVLQFAAELLEQKVRGA